MLLHSSSMLVCGVKQRAFWDPLRFVFNQSTSLKGIKGSSVNAWYVSYWVARKRNSQCVAHLQVAHCFRRSKPASPSPKKALSPGEAKCVLIELVLDWFGQTFWWSMVTFWEGTLGEGTKFTTSTRQITSCLSARNCELRLSWGKHALSRVDRFVLEGPPSSLGFHPLKQRFG